MIAASGLTLLDGGMGQELIRRSKSPPSPMWSAKVLMDEPEIVETVHREFITAGAHYITLNSYSATPERLARDASESLFEPLQKRAIEVAQNARGTSGAKITGCLPPLFGSYHPEHAPDYETCAATYRRIVSIQQSAVDVFLCETMSSIKEATAATSTAKESGRPVWCALSVSETDGTILRSGEKLADALAPVKEAGADAILLNCSPPEVISEGMPILANAGMRMGAYANGFTKADDLPVGGTVAGLEARKDLDPETYADFCAKWIEAGATVIGGCCEVGPDHIAELNRRFMN